jgi:hypothetical protein
MEVNGKLHVPDVLPPGKELKVSIRQKARWVPEPVWKL